jgi:outer membrane murein-binding lipoprotein Lpp
VPFFSGINDIVGEALTGAAAANAHAAASTSGPTFAGGAGVLRIEPDQVDAAIQIFQDALNKLEDKVTQARAQIRAEAMAADQVSTPAAAAFNDASDGGPGAAISAWTGAVREMQAIIEQLKAAKEANVHTDETVAQPFATATGG